MCQETDAQHISTGKFRVQEARIHRRQMRLQAEEDHTVEEEQLYDADIAD